MLQGQSHKLAPVKKGDGIGGGDDADKSPIE
jgi:hypothetical protein